jgi:hypothetical protein
MTAPSKDSSEPLKKEESGGKGREVELKHPKNCQFLN